ncbi:hypothetical protein PCG10_009525 [Penicillium crustosum]|uniref:Antigenic thaumatin-like protein n=1 Tax=Penicillium crustosum TaxID=36656 RepID=A0A9P5GXE0_PENCR|nr:uncharacterized protein N7487_000341 [Penicillium crustosum]KAF7528812.1 hypothetical protein PCG10_009525 [Penicillium crustosum]KAJ5416791.1 hypothetical protein N7487_000341 [Penicillium crustosum]
MRFNVIGLSALLAMTASALPVAVPDVQYVKEIVWETVYETVYQTPAAISAPTNLVEAVAIPSTTSVPSSTWTPVVPSSTVVPTLSVPTVLPTTTSAPSTFSSAASSTTVTPSSTSSSATATGSGISIVNNLSQTVYLWVVTETAGEMQTLSSGETFHDTWLTNTNGGGISIKMSTTEVCDDVLQFEYTQSGDVLYWDMSSINLLKTSAFVSAGFGVTISDESCTTSTCAPGDADCVESYQQPDDVNTLACALDAAYTLTLG